MKRYDAVIIGGGPAGSTCAWKLGRAGLNVLVLDKSTFPRDKPCAGWITPPVLTLLEINPHEYGRGRIFQPMTGFRISRLGGREIQTDYGRPVSFGIRRCEFDHFLLHRSGAATQLGQPLRTLEPSGNQWRVNEEIETPLVIGAGGHFCPVARYLGARMDGPGPVVATQELEFEMDVRQTDECRVRREIPELYFCTDLLGYGWCVRKGDHLNIGLGREDSRGLSEHVRYFVQRLHRAGRIPRDTPTRFRGHAYTLYGRSPRKSLGDGLMLIGDAAGLAAVPSGEGIRTAVESGLLAADAVLAAAGDYGCDRLEGYQTALVRRFGPPASDDGSLAYVPARLKQSIAGWLLATRWFTRRIVLERWFLHATDLRRNFAG